MPQLRLRDWLLTKPQFPSQLTSHVIYDEKSSTGASFVPKFLWVSPANNHSTTAPYPFITDLTRQHTVMSPCL